MAAMILAGLMLLGVQAADAAPADDAEPEEIVVTGKRNGCNIEVANAALSDQQFDARAREWAAGKPVQVRARYDEDVRCLAKIAFRLARHGVTRMTFVDPKGRPADPFKISPGTVVQPAASAAEAEPAGAAPSVNDAERRFFRRRAAALVLDHKCADARKMLLQAGDLEGAADVAAVCKAQ